MDWHGLQKLKVTQLRSMAQERGVTGTSGLTKDALVELMAEKLGIERPHLVVTDASANSTIYLAAGFVGLLILDTIFSAWGLAPRWWLRLRVMLTVVVVACLALPLQA